MFITVLTPFCAFTLLVVLIRHNGQVHWVAAIHWSCLLGIGYVFTLLDYAISFEILVLTYFIRQGL